MRNVLLELYYRTCNDAEASGLESYALKFKKRRQLARRFSWAIPTNEVIDQLVKLPQPMVELGAGTGYWAALLASAGAEVHAFDKHVDSISNKYRHKPRYFKVESGTPETVLVGDACWKTLMLCWPDYSTSFAFDSIRRFNGSHVVYIGEGSGGCTACDKFHDFAEQNFFTKAVLSIPQWWGIHDSVFVLERK